MVVTTKETAVTAAFALILTAVSPTAHCQEGAMVDPYAPVPEAMDTPPEATADTPPPAAPEMVESEVEPQSEPPAPANETAEMAPPAPVEPEATPQPVEPEPQPAAPAEAAATGPADVILVEANYMPPGAKCPKIADILSDDGIVGKLSGDRDTKILKSKSTVSGRNNYLEDALNVTFEFGGKMWAARPSDKYQGALTDDFGAMKTKSTVGASNSGCEYSAGTPPRKVLLIRQVTPTN